MLAHHWGQGKITWKGTARDFEIMYVQYDCNPPSSFWDLLRKRRECQNIQKGHVTEPKIIPNGTTRPLGVVCKIWRQSVLPEICSGNETWTNIIQFLLWAYVLNIEITNILNCLLSAYHHCIFCNQCLKCSQLFTLQEFFCYFHVILWPLNGWHHGQVG